jgi:hypothetical protein
MSFLPNIEDFAKKKIGELVSKIEAIDADHDGLPDLAEAKQLIAEGFAELQVLEAKVTPTEMVTALNLLFPGKFNEAEIQSAEAALAKLGTAITHVEGVMTSAAPMLGAAPKS